MTTSDAPNVHLLVDAPLRLGEGPIWHEDEQRLYYTDIEGATLYRYDPASGTSAIAFEGETVTGMTIQADGSLLLFQDRGRISHLRGGRAVPIRPPIAEDADTRFNDVIAAPDGRVYCGTMPARDRPGRLYLLDLDRSVTTVIDDAGISNGMGFPSDGVSMLHTNTTARTITRYRRDRSTGLLTQERVVVRVGADEPGGPDGMSLDADGTIWSAHYGGSGVFHYNENGHRLGMVPLPARNVTSIAFGGSDYRTAFVTTAGGQDRAANGTLAGSLFGADLGIGGRPPFRSRIRID